MRSKRWMSGYVVVIRTIDGKGWCGEHVRLLGMYSV